MSQKETGLDGMLTLWPAFALVSINMTFSSLACFSPSSGVTSRFSFKSVLLPTRTMITWSPRSARTSSIHRVVFTNESRSIVCQLYFSSLSMTDGSRRRLTRNVVNNHRHGGVPDIARNQASESLLARRVPQLQPDRLVLKVHGLGQEVDTDGCL